MAVGPPLETRHNAESAPNCDRVVRGCGSRSRMSACRRPCLHDGRAGFGSGRLSRALRRPVAVFAHGEADQKQRGDYPKEDNAHHHFGAHDLCAFAPKRPMEGVIDSRFAGISLLMRYPTRGIYYMIDNICQDCIALHKCVDTSLLSAASPLTGRWILSVSDSKRSGRTLRFLNGDDGCGGYS